MAGLLPPAPAAGLPDAAWGAAGGRSGAAFSGIPWRFGQMRFQTHVLCN